MALLIIKEKISKETFQKIAAESSYGDAIVKVVADIQRNVIAVGCDFHMDCAEELFENGSLTQNLWGANIYPKDKKIDFISLINIKPAENNRSMEIQNEEIKRKIEEIIKKFLDW